MTTKSDLRQTAGTGLHQSSGYFGHLAAAVPTSEHGAFEPLFFAHGI
jgi:hypothetical protein